MFHKLHLSITLDILMADTLVQISPFFGHGIAKGTGKIMRIDNFIGTFTVTCKDKSLGDITIYQTPMGHKELTFNDEVKLSINEGKESKCGVGAGIWMSSLVLSCWIRMNRNIFENQRVLELGSGVGLCGLVIASLQKSARFLKLTDKTSSLCDLVNGNIERNSKLCSIIPSVQVYDWQLATNNEISANDHLQGVYDVIIAADCLYDNTKNMLKQAVLKNLAKGGMFILANPPETSRAGMDDFIYALKEHGKVSIHSFHITMTRGGYTKEIYIVVLQNYGM